MHFEMWESDSTNSSYFDLVICTRYWTFCLIQGQLLRKYGKNIELVRELRMGVTAFIHASPNRTIIGRLSLRTQWAAVNTNFSDINVPAQLNLVFIVNASKYPSAAWDKKNAF